MIGEQPRATELDYLRWLWVHSDFGPADGDVRRIMEQEFIEETGTIPPEGWYCCDECGEDKAGGCCE